MAVTAPSSYYNPPQYVSPLAPVLEKFSGLFYQIHANLTTLLITLNEETPDLSNKEIANLVGQDIMLTDPDVLLMFAYPANLQEIQHAVTFFCQKNGISRAHVFLIQETITHLYKQHLPNSLVNTMLDTFPRPETLNELIEKIRSTWSNIAPLLENTFAASIPSLNIDTCRSRLNELQGYLNDCATLRSHKFYGEPEIACRIRRLGVMQYKQLYLSDIPTDHRRAHQIKHHMLRNYADTVKKLSVIDDLPGDRTLKTINRVQDLLRRQIATLTPPPESPTPAAVHQIIGYDGVSIYAAAMQIFWEFCGREKLDLSGLKIKPTVFRGGVDDGIISKIWSKHPSLKDSSFDEWVEQLLTQALRQNNQLESDFKQGSSDESRKEVAYVAFSKVVDSVSMTL